MPTSIPPQSQTTLSLDERERSELLALLTAALGDTRVEVHHTHSPNFRTQIELREQTLRGLIEKLRHSSV